MFRRCLIAIAVAMLLVTGVFAQTFNGNLLPGQNDGTGGPNVLPKDRDEIQNTTPKRYTVRQYVGNAGAAGGPLSASSVLNCPPIGKIGDLVF